MSTTLFPRPLAAITESLDPNLPVAVLGIVTSSVDGQVFLVVDRTGTVHYVSDVRIVDDQVQRAAQAAADLVEREREEAAA